MKMIIRIGAGIAILLALFYGVARFLPKSADVEQAVYLDAVPDEVFPLLSNPTNWKNWNAWNKSYDPSLILMYGGPEHGTGARQSWSGDRIGNWRMVFVQSSAPDTLQYELIKEGDTTKSIGNVTLQPTGKGTTLTWHQHTPIVDSPLELYQAAWQNYKTQKQIKLGLENLQRLISDKREQTAKK